MKSKLIVNGIVFNHDEIIRFGFTDANRKIIISLKPSEEYKCVQARDVAPPEKTLVELYNDSDLVWTKSGFTHMSAAIGFSAYGGFEHTLTIGIDEGQLL